MIEVRNLAKSFDGNKVLKDIKLIYSCLLIILILFVFILLFNKIIKININKFFKKINN